MGSLSFDSYKAKTHHAPAQNYYAQLGAQVDAAHYTSCLSTGRQGRHKLPFDEIGDYPLSSKFIH